MTSPDFAELKERLCRKQYVDIYVQREHDTAIIIELLEIIQSQSELLKELNTDNFVYDDHCTDIGDRVDRCEVQTNTRLQKLRDGK